jgi:hypothetical protein
VIDAAIHYQGAGSERRQLPAVPAAGCYLFGPGRERRLWEVAAVVIGGAGVAVYAVEVSPRLAGELTAAWAAWGEGGCTGDVDDCTCPTCAQRRLDEADQAHRGPEHQEPGVQSGFDERQGPPTPPDGQRHHPGRRMRSYGAK